MIKEEHKLKTEIYQKLWEFIFFPFNICTVTFSIENYCLNYEL